MALWWCVSIFCRLTATWIPLLISLLLWQTVNIPCRCASTQKVVVTALIRESDFMRVYCCCVCRNCETDRAKTTTTIVTFHFLAFLYSPSFILNLFHHITVSLATFMHTLSCLCRYLPHMPYHPAHGAVAVRALKRSTVRSDTSQPYQKPFLKTQRGSIWGKTQKLIEGPKGRKANTQ